MTPLTIEEEGNQIWVEKLGENFNMGYICEEGACSKWATYTLYMEGSNLELGGVSTVEYDLCRSCLQDVVRRLVDQVTALTDQTGGWLKDHNDWVDREYE